MSSKENSYERGKIKEKEQGLYTAVGKIYLKKKTERKEKICEILSWLKCAITATDRRDYQ